MQRFPAVGGGGGQEEGGEGAVEGLGDCGCEGGLLGEEFGDLGEGLEGFGAPAADGDFVCGGEEGVLARGGDKGVRRWIGSVGGERGGGKYVPRGGSNACMPCSMLSKRLILRVSKPKR